MIEDVCESHGATHDGRKLGSFGLISNFSFYYAHHMSTIEGGMVCTNDFEIYQQVRMLRSHGLLRESSSELLRTKYTSEFPDLNPEFIFVQAGFNFRNTEIGAIIGLSQLQRLDAMIEKRTKNQSLFFELIDKDHFETNFMFEGSSNYAFNLLLKNKDQQLMDRLIELLNSNNIEFRRGSAGGGNQLRQPYLKNLVQEDEYKKYPNTVTFTFLECI